MTKKITLINAETNQVVERELNEQELADFTLSIESGLQRKNEALAKLTNAKNALLALGLDPVIAAQIAGVNEAEAK